MAESKNNVVMHGASGKVDIIVFSQRHGKTVISKAPQRHAASTPAQVAQQQKFQQAVLYAKSALADPATKAAYEAAASEGQSAYNVAVADFLHAPGIEQVDVTAYTGAVGSTIKIKVADDYLVKSVQVKIENSDASLVEQGAAVQDASNGLYWIYTATAANASLSGDKITVTATDTPGNATQQEQDLP